MIRNQEKVRITSLTGKEWVPTRDVREDGVGLGTKRDLRRYKVKSDYEFKKSRLLYRTTNILRSQRQRKRRLDIIEKVTHKKKFD